MSEQMQLKSLHVSLQSWGVHEGKYAGTAEFTNQSGRIEIALSPEMSAPILALCAEALMQNTRALAETMTANILLPSQPALSAPVQPPANDDDCPF